MVTKHIINDLGLDDLDIESQVEAALGVSDMDEMQDVIDATVLNFESGTLLKGTIVNHIGDDVIIEVGLKSEGVVSSYEFDSPDEIVIGDQIEVLLETVESESGLVQLSKRKADRIRGWENILENYGEGDTIKGKVVRRIKGGLLVDVGVPVFLPASQVDIRRPGDISEFISTEIEAKILKIDRERRNIVISRRKLLEETRVSARNTILADIEEGQVRKGIVKNIADFGVFIDLGGLDGLLHITDMSWGRVGHPSVMVSFDQEIEVKIISVDRENEKVALGLKQITENPWLTVEDRYPLKTIVKGHVVNLMNYGVFVKLEDGVEGLIHISEMSWTKRINHPGEVLSIGQEIDVTILAINPPKQEISLGIKQLTDNPWTAVAAKYPPGTIIEGTIRNLANYGAFIEIEEGIDGLLHVSDMSWTKKISHPGELLKKGDPVKCMVISVDQEKQRVALGLKQMTEDPWVRAVPEKYIPGQIVNGVVTKLTNFGVFVQLEPELEGLLHISELSDDKVEGPQDIVKPGQELEVKILRVDIEDRKIGLSLKRVQWAAEDGADGESGETKPQRGGLGGLGESGIGSKLIDNTLLQQHIQPVVVTGQEAEPQEVPSEKPSAEEAAPEPNEEPSAEEVTPEPSEEPVKE
jgi:small subunit ribosomal protein S1